jgi:glycerophosphoryl diester phosphodiesterase
MYPVLPIPAIIAHRGASAHAPENTIAAFELAVSQGADAIELDLDICQDEHLMVIHDRSVDRTTEGSGWIKDLSLSTLKQLDAGSHFDIAYKGEPIPTLDEVFEIFGNRIVINIELKRSAGSVNRLAEKVATAIHRHRLLDSIIISSFYPSILFSIRKILPDIAIALLTVRGVKGAFFRSRIARLLVPYQALHPDLNDVSISLVRRIHNIGGRINVYTVNNPEDIVSLINTGVDGIITNDPLLMKNILRSGTPVVSSY